MTADAETGQEGSEMPAKPTQNQPRLRSLAEADVSAPESVTVQDSVAVSERARELSRAQEAVESAPDIRADKVARLKQQIENGSYSVPAEMVAEKLLDESGDR